MSEKIGVIGGLGTLAGGDLFFKLLKNKTVLANQLNYHFLFEQRPYSQINLPLHQVEDIKSRKFYSYTVCKNFEAQGVTKVLLPCFASHTFIEELQKEVDVPIVSMYNALVSYIKLRFKSGSRIGVLTSDYVRESNSIHKIFPDYELVFPNKQSLLMEAIYGDNGIKNGYLDGISLEYVHEVCTELIEKGCELIIPGITDLSLIAEPLWRRGIRLLDVNQIYADYVLSTPSQVVRKEFKLGILGGVGPKG